MHDKIIIHSPNGEPQTIEIIKEGNIDFTEEAKMLYDCLQQLPHLTYQKLKKMIINGD